MFTITLLQAKSQATTEATKAVISHSVTNPSGIVLDQFLCRCFIRELSNIYSNCSEKL
jgi:hypothetical protein